MITGYFCLVVHLFVYSFSKYFGELACGANEESTETLVRGDHLISHACKLSLLYCRSSRAGCGNSEPAAVAIASRWALPLRFSEGREGRSQRTFSSHVPSSIWGWPPSPQPALALSLCLHWHQDFMGMKSSCSSPQAEASTRRPLPDGMMPGTAPAEVPLCSSSDRTHVSTHHCPVHLFPRAAGTNHHQLKIKWIDYLTILEGRSLTGLKIAVSARLGSCWSPRGESVSLLFPTSRGPLRSWLLTLFLHVRSQHQFFLLSDLCFCHHISSSDSDPPASLL